jgi:AraC-like DNA-binding protein/mannose-6-phosphate isomerase-like protein (cupin superfamily)
MAEPDAEGIPLSSRQHHEAFEDETCLLEHVPIIGYQRYIEAVANGLVPEAHPDAYEFHYVLRGDLDWWVDNETYRVKPGTVFMTRPGEMHGSRDTFFQPTELYWFQLKIPRSKPMTGLTAMETKFLRQELSSLTERMFSASHQIRPAFECILDEHRFPTTGSRIIARAGLHQLIGFLIRDHDMHVGGHGGATKLSPQIQSAVELIHSNLGEPPPIDTVASEVCMSPGHFRARFRRETGFSPYEYLTRCRIDKAKKMLLCNRWSVTDVAFRLGYSSSQNFASSFKRQTGMAPTEFRRTGKAPLTPGSGFDNDGKDGGHVLITPHTEGKSKTARWA